MINLNVCDKFNASDTLIVHQVSTCVFFQNN